MRGEHSIFENQYNGTQGSSPHARGTHDAVRNVGLVDGIIPACAGNTVNNLIAASHERDHPRMRGEHDGRDVFDD